MKVVITGATGFIGQKLLTNLALSGNSCVALVRDLNSATTLPCKPLVWDLNSEIAVETSHELAGANAWVHLAGEPIAAHRWNTETKKRIYDSRIRGTRHLVDAIRKMSPSDRPKTLIAGSAIGFYGGRQDEVLNETSEQGEGFLAEVVKDWEAEALKAVELGVRVVLLRTGIVLGLGGGALTQMQPVILGSGKQWMSWVHLDDVIAFIRFAIDKEALSGIFNLAAPRPETNASFTRLYSKAIGARVVLWTPAMVIKLMMGEMACIVLDSTRVSSTRAVQAGFNFKFQELASALRDLYPAPLERRLSFTQFIPRPIEEVFSYFSRAENLEEITPPWLNFRIVRMSSAETKEGTLIDYRLKIHGVPCNWQSKIENWVPQKQFVDSQVKGPYRKWHHSHRFEPLQGGTLVLDEVIYQLPAGKVGSIFGDSFVKRDVEKIFSYRRKKILEVFKS